MNKIVLPVTAVTLGGAAQSFELGFTARKIRILNATDRTELIFDDIDTVNTFGLTVGATGTKAKAADADHGLVLTSGDHDTKKGFTLGKDAVVLDTTADVLVIEAWGELV